ncbi:unnamed protein product [Peronospora farinosa]|uniref:3-dehydroquinate dehydratase n=1 Tax=Peronospora farinosa TaxID=134698 RepID=A0AAV0U1J0_9STRA|nr:unnamed protein product [Peronospora farinosa]
MLALGRRRTVSLLLQPRRWCPLSSKAGQSMSNPLEIDLSPLQTPVSTTEKLTLSDAINAWALQEKDAENDIDRLHYEMSELFGEQVAEYEGERSFSIAEKDVTVLVKTTWTEKDGTELYREDGVNAGEMVNTEQSEESLLLDTTTTTVRTDAKFKKKQNFSGENRTDTENASDTSLVNVLLLQGPCSFVRGVWTGGDVGRKELWQQIQALADDLKVVIKGHNYDSEKMVLEKILDAREDQVIVLCWNISLSKSPFIVHALELIQSSAIIVSPSNVEHGPLPANVVGVLSGFRNQSLSLALNAAANLCGPNANKDQKFCKTSDIKSVQGSLRNASVKKANASSAKAKKSILTCYLCGNKGHIRSECPDLPRNKT